MHKKYAEMLTVTQFNAIHAAAVAHGVTVDAVVHAWAGRTDDSKAIEAMHMLPASVFTGLNNWPMSCQFCCEPHDREVRCAHCYRTGCAKCITGKGCPKCVEDRANIIASRKSR